jgi:hypothetical protein
MKKITEEDLQEAFTAQFADAAVSGSPEAMFDRMRELYGIDVETVGDVINDQLNRLLVWMGSNQDMIERTKDMSEEEVQVFVTRNACLLLSMRFFIAGFLVAVKRTEDATL